MKTNLQFIIIFLFIHVNLFSQDLSENSDFVFNKEILAIADFNNDGTKEILINGWEPGMPTVLEFYKVGNNKAYISYHSINLSQFYYIEVSTADFDNDGFLDLLLVGSTTGGDNPKYATYILKNTGNGTFEDKLSLQIPSLIFGHIATCDFNNDGKIDFIKTGQDETGKVSTILFKNNGDFDFSPLNDLFISVRYGSSDWADYNNDGYTDVLIAGENVTADQKMTPIAQVYVNNKNGTFSLSEVKLTGISYGLGRWGDYDDDGDLDILISGGYAGNGVFKVYNNDGTGVFNEIVIPEIKVLGYQTTAWEDFNNDGDLDIFYSGLLWDSELKNWSQESYLISYDNGYLVKSFPINALDNPSCKIIDYDNDDDLDILYQGTSSFQTNAKFLTNNSIPNTTPAAPGNLKHNFTFSNVNLSWDNSSDIESKGLTYEIRLEKIPEKQIIFSGSLVTGERLTYERGKYNKNSCIIPKKNLQAGQYRWAVQSIDVNYRGSLFSSPDTFILEPYALLPDAPVNFKSAPVSERIIDLSWSYISENPKKFILERSIDNLNFIPFKEIPGGQFYYRDKELEPKVRYFYRIKAVIEELESVYSDTCSSVTYKVPYLSKVYEEEIVKDKLNSTGASWGDLNNDNLLDLCVINGNSPIHIFKNLGNGSFSKTELESNGLATSVVWVDLNDDDYLDLFITKGWPEKNSIYLNNKNETFSQFFDSNILNDPAGDNASAWTDFDKDSLIDVFICGRENPNRLYRNLGKFKFELVSLEDQQSDNSSVGCNWIDYNNDGLEDLFIANYYKKNQLYKNKGNGTFEKITEGNIVNDVEPSVSGAWADFDNDSDMDLLVVNNVNMDNSFYENLGNGTFSRNKKWPFANQPEVTGGGNGASWEDIDNDGDMDLFISNYFNNKLYLSNYSIKDSSFTLVTDEPYVRDYGYSVSALWGDYNNDGNIDLFIPNSNSEVNYLYKNNGYPLPGSQKSTSATSSNKRILIRLKGRISNSWGLGSKIVVQYGNKSVTRYITTQSGVINSTNNILASIGVEQNQAPSITVYWPSGIVQRLTNPRLNELNIIEETLQTSVSSNKDIQEHIFIYPNPFENKIQIEIPEQFKVVRISILNSMGKLCKNINEISQPVEINVQDLKPGTYILKIETGDSFICKKIIKI